MMHSIRKVLRGAFYSSGRKSDTSPWRVVVAWILFTMIILVFIFWGAHPMDQNIAAGGPAAQVNRSAISQVQLERAFQNRQRQNPTANEEQRQAELARTLGDLIAQAAREQSVEAAKIFVTDEEVQKRIQEFAAFKNAQGQFDYARYKQLLEANGLRSGDFEDDLRSEAGVERIGRLFAAATQGIKLEAERMKSIRDTKINAGFLRISLEEIVKPSSLSSAEVTEFLAKPEAQERVKAYFEQNRVGKFTTQEQVKARHILINIDSKLPDGEARAKEKATDLVKQIRAGADFAKLARENSGDPGSKASGGDLGFFGRGQMVPEFESAAFGAQVGQVSDPVKSQFGFHIIQVQEKKAASERSLEEVREEIARTLLARDRSQSEIDKLSTLLSEGNLSGVESFAKRLGLKWDETGNFAADARSIPKVGPVDQFAEEAFSLTAERPLSAKLVRMGGEAYVVRHRPLAKEPAKPATAGGDADRLTKLMNDPSFMRRMGEQQRAQQAFQAWSNQALQESRVSCNASLLQGRLPRECRLSAAASISSAN